MWMQVYEVDFNNPMGWFSIEHETEDYLHGDAFPHVGDEVMLVCMEAKTHGFMKHYDAGFGMVCKVVSEEIRKMADGRTVRFYETDHFERRFGKKP